MTVAEDPNGHHQQRNKDVRVVTVRRLTRDTSRLFDEVAANGVTLLVTRHGLPVATIHPAALAPLRPVALPEIGSRPGSEDGGLDLDLDETQRKVLLALRTAANVDAVVATAGVPLQRAIVTVTQLEVQRLVARGPLGVGYQLTWRGRRAVEALDPPEDRAGDDGA